MAMRAARAPIQFTLVWLLTVVCAVESQVCSAPGKLCNKTTDCCRGCCEQYMCVERGYSCSPDLVSQSGSSSCINFHCPPKQICYLREVCPQENPCPRMPFCRNVNMRDNKSMEHGQNNGIELASRMCLVIGAVVVNTLRDFGNVL